MGVGWNSTAADKATSRLSSVSTIRAATTQLSVLWVDVRNVHKEVMDDWRRWSGTGGLTRSQGDGAAPRQAAG